MKEVIDVQTGEVEVGKGKVQLRSTAIGSCLVVAASDFSSRTGALAHIMLPGRAPGSDEKKTKYAYDAIKALLKGLLETGAQRENIQFCMVGAGNVLKKADDTICSDNIDSITEILREEGFSVKAAVLGGVERKGIVLDIQNGEVFYTEGDSEKKLLCKCS